MLVVIQWVPAAANATATDAVRSAACDTMTP
jgi:hypothetical protein